MRSAAAMAALIVGLVGFATYRGFNLGNIANDAWLGVYGAVATAYMLTRFLFSFLYRPAPDRGIEPSIAVVMPAFNEEKAIATSLRSLLAVDYPAGKLQMVAVNDGSTDATLAEMTAVAESVPGQFVIVDFAHNRGKRAAMAAGIRATDAEIVVFVDSDSTLQRDALSKIVQPFADPRIGAVCGHAEVANAKANWLTKMQAVWYCMAFKFTKGAESLFGAVGCCSGCFAAYRREAIMPCLAWFEEQRFLGAAATIGDDRSLTNCVLRRWRVVYHSGAVSNTIVPATVKGYVKQQTRWKRSFPRESLRIGSFIWRKHPMAAIAVYVNIAQTLLAPIIVARALVVHPPLTNAQPALMMLAGIFVISLVRSVYYVAQTRSRDTVWLWGMTWIFMYAGVMLWLTYYALLTCRSCSWGTRPSSAGTASRNPWRTALWRAVPARLAKSRAVA